MSKTENNTQEQKSRISKLAIASLVLAVLAAGLVYIDPTPFTLSVPIALITSLLSMRIIIRSRGKVTGIRLAISGVVISALIVVWQFGGGMLWHKYSLIQELKGCDNLRIFNSYYDKGVLVKVIVDEYSSNDKQVISKISDLISDTRFLPFLSRGVFATHACVGIEVCKDDRTIREFAIFSDAISLHHNLILQGIGKYRNSLQDKVLMTFPQTREQTLQERCEGNLVSLNIVAGWYSESKKGKYPEASVWCDELFEYHKKWQMEHGIDEPVEEDFICSAGPEGRCHYSINPYCESNSPNDVVFIFESKPGWNQYGGPKLISFGNHGGKANIILNDCTVRFIKPEEVDELNWGNKGKKDKKPKAEQKQ